MTPLPRLLLAAGLCASFACAGDDSEPASASKLEAGAAADTADAAPGTGTFDAGNSTGGALDSAVGPAAQDASPLLDAGSDAGHSDAGHSDAAQDSGRADGGRDASTADAGQLLHATISVAAGETFDGEGRRFRAGPELGDGSQSETQKPLFDLADGARLINVVLGAPAADGIHTHGDVTLENIVWEDIGEDALTIKQSGTVVLNGGSARDGEDKIFQINAPSTFRVSNFVARNAGKFIRQNGGTTYKIEVFIDACDIADMDEAIFRTDSTTSTVTMTNTRYSHIGKQLFMGVTPANVTSSNNTEY